MGLTYLREKHWHKNPVRKGGTMSRIRLELAGWIDADVIAEHILDELEEQGIQPTLDNAKTIWLDVLESELCEAIRSSVKAKFNV